MAVVFAALLLAEVLLMAEFLHLYISHSLRYCVIALSGDDLH